VHRCPGEAAQLAVGETKGMAMVKFDQHSDTATLFARILLSAVMWLYGYFKLTGFAGAVTYMSRQGFQLPQCLPCSPLSSKLGEAC
jgi:hypothetical protein